MQTHLRPTAAIAESAVLTGDPKRAMDLAAKVMERPLMSNLSRGLWGYWGHDASSGNELTVQSTGIGGPSAAAILGELAALGVKRAIRVGTCVALDPGLVAGNTLVVGGALPGDGIGRSAKTRGALPTSQELTEPLGSARLVASLDLMAEPGSPTGAFWRAQGAAALDLSTAALLVVAEKTGIRLGCALVVAVSADGHVLGHDDLDAAVLALGADATRVLSQARPQPASPAP